MSDAARAAGTPDAATPPTGNQLEQLWSQAAQPATPTTSARLRSLKLSRPVMDFLEQVEILTHHHIVRFQLQRALIRFAGLLEQAFMFVRHRQVVEGRGVTGINLGGAPRRSERSRRLP